MEIWGIFCRLGPFLAILSPHISRSHQFRNYTKISLLSWIFSDFFLPTLVIIRQVWKSTNFFQKLLYRWPSWICLYLKFPMHKFAWFFCHYIDPYEGLGAKIGELLKMSYYSKLCGNYHWPTSVRRVFDYQKEK